MEQQAVDNRRTGALAQVSHFLDCQGGWPCAEGSADALMSCRTAEGKHETSIQLAEKVLDSEGKMTFGSDISLGRANMWVMICTTCRTYQEHALA